MKKYRPPRFVLLGFLAASFIILDLGFRFFFIHDPWPEEPYLLTGASVLLVAFLVDLGQTTLKLRRTEAELRSASADLQRRVDERTAELEEANRRLMAVTVERERIEERQRLARDLHDSVAQTLYGVALGINTATTFLDTDRKQTEEALNYALKLTNMGLVEMRALIFDLHPATFDIEGLVVAITRRATGLRVRNNIEVELDLCDEPAISSQAKEALFWIAEEALQNAVRHAHADQLDVRLACDTTWLTLEICDNGSGFDPNVGRPGHVGLRSMRERAEAVGGTLDITSAPGCGTQIRARIPLPPSGPR